MSHDFFFFFFAKSEGENHRYYKTNRQNRIWVIESNHDCLATALKYGKFTKLERLGVSGLDMNFDSFW